MTIALSSIMPQLQRAQAMLQSGQGALAWPMLAPLRTAIDGDGQALRLYALAAHSAGRIDEAIDALKRIAALEGQPTDILGAIADTLAKAGRHAEAYEQWGALTARDPKIVDAHLNRAVAAANAGLHDEALDAADTGLKLFPGDARLLAAKAMALKNAERIDEALDAFALAVAADPARAMTRHNQAVTLRAACRFEEACEAYGEAERLGMTGAQFHANWAAAALEAERIDQAEALYRKALADNPALDEARKGLTRIRIEYGDGKRAFDHYEEATRQQPRNARLWLDWANALIINRRMADALQVVDRGLSSHPALHELQAVKIFIEGMLGDPGPALDSLEALLGGGDTQSPTGLLITQLAFRAGRPELAAGILEQRAANHPGDQLAWSMLSLAWRLLDDPREHWLCDYDRLIMVAEVPSPDGGMDPADYAREVAALLDPLHVTKSEPGDQSLRGGTQTSSALFSRPDPGIQRFREAVSLAAANAVAKLPDDPAHPFLRRKSRRFGFSGSWSVRLRAGGHHASHVHPQGWMSSAYYARLPGSSEQANSRHEGWIQFGVPSDQFGIELPPRRIIEPRPGRLVLFPSYMWHGTIPFGSGDRLTAAFDYQPL